MSTDTAARFARTEANVALALVMNTAYHRAHLPKREARKIIHEISRRRLLVSDPADLVRKPEFDSGWTGEITEDLLDRWLAKGDLGMATFRELFAEIRQLRSLSETWEQK